MEEADDWNHPITQEELEAIDAAISSYSGADHRRPPMNGGCDDLRRRLPHSLVRPVNRATNEAVLNRCPRDRPIDLDYQSRQANLKVRLPALNFGGRIVYCKTVNEVEKATKELLDLVSTKQRENGEAVLGFDLEWRPTFKRGFSPGKVAVMQICGNTDCCYVIHIIHSGIPQILQSLLEDPTSTKVGIGIANDSFKLFKDYQISTQSLSDLAGLANQKFGGYPKKWSLEALTESVISKQLPKLKKIRLGNWEVDCLSKEQLQYAATDAYASWYLYKVLENLPDAPKNEGIDGAPSILPDAPKNEGIDGAPSILPDAPKNEIADGTPQNNH